MIWRDISKLGCIPSHVDFRLAVLASIYGISNMISEYHRVSRGSSHQWSALVTSLWQQELLQILEQFKFLAVEPLQRLIPAIPLVYHTVSYIVIIFAAWCSRNFFRQGWQRAIICHIESFIQHISSVHLRDASWHAGQVLRIARSMPPKSLTASRSVCVYFSGLALWCLGAFSLQMRWPRILRVRVPATRQCSFWMAMMPATHDADSRCRVWEPLHYHPAANMCIWRIERASCDFSNNYLVHGLKDASLTNSRESSTILLLCCNAARTLWKEGNRRQCSPYFASLVLE